ncbi:amino acid ABC transporter ATP-binding protein [Terrisporobacter petrolearius]|uniref:amino acid ABC transporter ATP-binding protein n=1 Tax=Terrisporobacter petrolearius TaxID=1460447 RepID=UPI0022E0E5EF|nr:amino acid ABC transporter ATP-binding protein [Terrisporobacter petrolearius]
MIEIKDLRVKFGNNEVLKGINLSIKKGEVVALIGPSGTGKSTLLRCLNYLTKPTKGNIRIDDFIFNIEKATNKDIHNLRKKTAMVFQNYNLLKNKTAVENIMEPMITVQKIHKEKAYEKAIELLDKVGLKHKKDSYPRELSGGQQQRIGIARAMAVSSDVILFDEPTSSLDPELVGEVLSVIKDLALSHNKTMVIVTHEMKFAKEVADRMIFLENGVVAGEGTPEEIYKNCQNERMRKFINILS